MLKTKERIISTTDLQTNLALTLKNAQKQPLIITSEGEPTAYMLGIDMFDAILERLFELEQQELLGNITIGEKQFEQNDYLSLQEATAQAEAHWQKQETIA